MLTTHFKARRSDITETSLLYQARFSFTELAYLNLLLKHIVKKIFF